MTDFFYDWPVEKDKNQWSTMEVKVHLDKKKLDVMVHNLLI